MSLLTIAEEARLHQEMYVSLLNSTLGYGEHREFARRAHITPEYLSMIRNLDRDPPAIPSPKVVTKIITAVDGPPELRESLEEHMILAHQKRLSVRRQAKRQILEGSLAELVTQIGNIHHQATFAMSPDMARQGYSTAQALISMTLELASLEADPLAYAKLCLIAHDVQNALNRRGKASWNAKRAHAIMSVIDRTLYRSTTVESFDYLSVNAAYAEAEAYRTMKLYKEAFSLYQKAEQMELLKYNEAFWRPAILIGSIVALANTPRFVLADAVALASCAEEILENSTEATAPMFNLFRARALAIAYIHHRNFKDAERELELVLKSTDTTPFVGYIHKARFLKTRAYLEQAKGDTLGSHYFLHEADLLTTQFSDENDKSSTST
jgi:tetratricopeptide (TPR) repeat protein